MGPACLFYAFSDRHLDAHNKTLSLLVFAWRIAIILLPLGIITLFAVR
jgi:hypothetical protein